MPVLPSSLIAIVSLLRPAFTAPTFQTFEALLAGMIGRVGERTVCGMWQAARLGGLVHHSVGHDFFARSRWSTDDGAPIGVVTLMTAGTNVIAIVGGLAVMGDALGATPALAAVHGASFVMVVFGGALAASEFSGVGALADLQETAMPRVPPRACPAVLDRVG